MLGIAKAGTYFYIFSVFLSGKLFLLVSSKNSSNEITSVSNSLQKIIFNLNTRRFSSMDKSGYPDTADILLVKNISL